MSSAASKAAKNMGSSKRNRPSLSMSQRGSQDEDAAAIAPTNLQSTPLFMDDVNSQYQSLSERLARENAMENPAPSSAADDSAPPRKQKVRWAETAALASTLDAAKAGENDDDNDYPSSRSSPLEAISDLFQKKYTMPVFLIMATSIFLMVHLSGRGEGGNQLYSDKAELSVEGPQDVTLRSSPKDPAFDTLQNARSFNIGQGDGFTSLIFSFVPTPAPGNSETEQPTIEAMLHTTPKMVRAGIPSPLVAGEDGYEPGWILVPTSSNGGGDGLQAGDAGVKEGWGYPPGVPTPDPALLNVGSNGGFNDPNAATAPDKWGIPQGMPTPDPALLSNVSPVTQNQVGLSWGYPPGVPTPNPDLLVEIAPDNTSPTTLKWNIPLGQPTPDPALLYQIDNASPTTLKWKIPYGQPTPDPAFLYQVDNTSPTTLKWKIPYGQPTPDPALLTEVAPDNASPTTLQWKIPLGKPTPDPALLNNPSPVTLGWGYPPGVPTPDPALLAGVPDKVTWGYPPGVPTPDPALLEGVVVSMSWGYPPGVPTPDPALLRGETSAPTLRSVETGRDEKVTICHRTDNKANPWVEMEISSNELQFHLDHGDKEGLCAEVAPQPEDVTLKMPEAPKEPNVTPPPAPDVSPPPISPPPISPPPNSPPPNSPPTPIDVLVEPPTTSAPSGPKDSGGLAIEVAPPPPAPKIPIMVKNPPTPQVNTQPYSGDYGWYRPLGDTGNRPGTGSGVKPGKGPGVNTANQGVNGYVMAGGCGGCFCGCCGCGGGYMGGMGVVPLSDGSNTLMVPQFMQGTMGLDTRFSLPGLPQPQCPWDCMIDETVPTMGRSNEDDAIYEIFYTNPLNCCGTIVEIGAGNGKDNSPSFFFEYGMNWTAILTEADPVNFEQITKTRTGDKAMIINGAFCQEGSYIYFDEKSALFQTVNAGEYSSEALSQTRFIVTDTTPKVECIRLDSDVLSGLDHVDVMVIRVKGDPWAVVRTMNWDITVDIWVILMEDRPGMLHDTLRAALKLHDYVPASWEIKLWCETPSNCMQNEVWLRKSFSALPKPLMGLGSPGLRGSIA
eukprot:CCRYP_003885-RF/>CCRYP_003885-RF protein AED:0.24 eAED:0.24 QI:261/0.93/0.88/1/0.87/0.76/17/258/1058